MLRRQHWFALVRGLSWPLLLLLAWAVGSPFAAPFISGLGPDPLGPPPEGVMALLPTCLWLAWIGLAVAFVMWAVYVVFDWRDDWVALTSRRLIVMRKSLFFREARSEASLDRVENVVADYPNGLALAFQYGNLLVDTAGVGVLAFDNMPQPKAMRDAIFAQQQVMLASRPKPDDLRKAVARDILQGSGTSDQPAPDNPPPATDTPCITWRKHWFFLVRGVGVPALLWVLAVCAWFVTIYVVEQGQPGVLSEVAGWIVLILALVCLIWAAYNWEDWRNDSYVLDGERLYDIERLPFGLREQSKQTHITRITDVSYLVPGPLAHLLDYGDVMLKTPGESTQLTFVRVPHPRQVQRLIMQRVEECHERERAVAAEEIEAWLKAYHDAQKQEQGTRDKEQGTRDKEQGTRNKGQGIK